MNEQHWALQCYKESRLEAKPNQVLATELGTTAISQMDERITISPEEQSKIRTAHYLELISQATSAFEVRNYKQLAEDIFNQDKIAPMDYRLIIEAAQKKIDVLSRSKDNL